MENSQNRRHKHVKRGPARSAGVNDEAVVTPPRNADNKGEKRKTKLDVKCSREQQKLFDLMADFAADTVVELIANGYDMFTRDTMRSTMLPILLSRIAEDYFNNVSKWIYDRSDKFINERFDAMLAVELHEIEESGNKKYDPIDLLHLIVAMSMQSLITMNIGDIVTDNRAQTLDAVRAHIRCIVGRFNHVALGLRGCNCDEPHTPPAADQKVFNIEIKKAVMDGTGTVEIKDDWFELV